MLPKDYKPRVGDVLEFPTSEFGYDYGTTPTCITILGVDPDGIRVDDPRMSARLQYFSSQAKFLAWITHDRTLIYRRPKAIIVGNELRLVEEV